MNYGKNTKIQLIKELELMRKKVVESESAISENKRSGEKLKQYGDHLLASVAGSAHVLLACPDINDAIDRALTILGEGADADRVYIFENHRDPMTGELLASMRFEWSKAGVASQKDNPMLLNAPYRDFFPRWQTNLVSGSPIKGLVRDFPDSEREFLEKQEIISLIVVPVMIEGRFWGFIGFDDCHEGKEWTDSMESILVAAAGNIGNAIERKRLEQILVKSETLYRGLFENASIGMFQTTLEGRLLLLNKAFATMLGYESPEDAISTITNVDRIHANPRNRAIILAALVQQDWFYAEQPYLRKDDSIMIGKLSIRKVVKQDGSIAFLEGIVEDITERKWAEEALLESEKELRIKARNLEEVNTTLKVLLKTMEKDQEYLEERFLTNIREQVLPYLENLKKTPLNDVQRGFIQIAETYLDDIASPFVQSLTSRYLNLTKKEIQIAALIKEGKTSKEIADLLNLSKRAIEFHRENIREKLGLKNKKGNMQILLRNFS